MTKELKFRRGEVVADVPKDKPQGPLGEGRFGTISRGFRERILRNLKEAALAASLRYGPIRRVQEGPVAAKIDFEKGGKETDRPIDGVHEFIIGMKDGSIRIGEVEETEYLGVGDTIRTSEGFTVALLDIELNGEGNYVAKITAYAPWLKEDLVFHDLREGGCVSVPLSDGREAGVLVTNITGSILRTLGSTALINILRDAGPVKNEG